MIDQTALEPAAPVKNRPIGFPSPENWHALHGAANQLKFGNCWENCASYCCRTNHPKQSFSLMKCNSAGMVFPLQEYRFLETHGLLQTGFSTSARFHNFVICPKRSLTLRFATAVCNLGGVCSLPDHRPLICKLYPHYPIPNAEDGRIEDFLVGSIIDQYWNDLELEHPCWLHRTQGQEVSRAIKHHLEEHLNHPYLIFYLGAAAIFVRMVSDIAKSKDLPKFKEDPVNFFRNWEIQYLMGRYIAVDDYRQQCVRLYDRIAWVHGEFEI